MANARSYLLDTCILSKLRKVSRVPDPRLENWIKKHPDSAFFISALTLGEIQAGISKLKTQEHKKLVLEDWFLNELIPRFRNRILPIDTPVAFTWGKLVGECQSIVIPVVDGLIAATAIVHNLTVVTENTQDFKAMGARIFNPWMD